MTPQAAEALAVRISQTWPKSPPVDVWAEDIADLDEGAAGTAFARLRRESDRTPTIAHFRQATLQIRTHDAGNPNPGPCGACSNTGWIEADELVDPTTTDHTGCPQRYTQMRPCACEHGRRASQSAVWQAR